MSETRTLPKAGWYPDPDRPDQQRYWDGTAWTEHRQPSQPAAAPVTSAAAAPTGKKAWYKRPGIVVAIVAGVVIVAAAGGSSSKSGSSSSSDDSAASAAEPASSKSAAPKTCGSKATDDCTPHVAANRSVRVDALIWKVKSARTASSIGDVDLGLGEKADGVFLIVNLGVHSDRDESATINNGMIKLQGNGVSYSADTDGTVAAIGAGQKPFFLDDIGPDATTSGKVVFDVPRRLLGKKLEIRFNELGFGQTHGYIRLPELD